MNRRRTSTIGIVGLVAMLCFSFVSQGYAADCLAIRKKIQQESDLLKRRELVKQGLSNCPNDPVINFKYAYSLERFRKYDEALKHYQVAAKLDPKYAKAYFGMGDMYLQIAKPHESVAAYQKGLSLDPNNKRAARSMQEALAQAKTAPAPVAVATAAQKKPTVTATVQASPSTPVLASTTMMPYSPGTKTIFQTPQNQLPVVANPLGKETVQSFKFTKAGHSDATGSLDDNLMGSN